MSFIAITGVMYALAPAKPEQQASQLIKVRGSQESTLLQAQAESRSGWMFQRQGGRPAA